MSDSPCTTEGLFERWVKATTLGWLLGLLILFALIALWSLVGEGAEFMVGIGIGAGVGLMQSRVLGEWLERPRAWAVATTVCMGAPFVLHDVMHAAGRPIPLSLPGYVLLGALVLGLWQASILRRTSSRAHWWPAACLAGWLVPAGCLWLADAGVAGAVGEMAGVAAIFLGGLMLGVASGPGLAWILRGPRPDVA